MSIFTKLLGAKNVCGVNDFKCEVCRKCQKEENDRWNKIWEQKYGEQEKKYYSQPPGERLEPSSRMQSSLATNLPIDPPDYWLPTEPGKRQLAGGKQRAAAKKKKREALSRV